MCRPFQIIAFKIKRDLWESRGWMLIAQNVPTEHGHVRFIVVAIKCSYGTLIRFNDLFPKMCDTSNYHFHDKAGFAGVERLDADCTKCSYGTWSRSIHHVTHNMSLRDINIQRSFREDVSAISNYRFHDKAGLVGVERLDAECMKYSCGMWSCTSIQLWRLQLYSAAKNIELIWLNRKYRCIYFIGRINGVQ